MHKQRPSSPGTCIQLIIGHKSKLSAQLNMVCARHPDSSITLTHREEVVSKVDTAAAMAKGRNATHMSTSGRPADDCGSDCLGAMLGTSLLDAYSMLRTIFGCSQAQAASTSTFPDVNLVTWYKRVNVQNYNVQKLTHTCSQKARSNHTACVIHTRIHHSCSQAGQSLPMPNDQATS